MMVFITRQEDVEGSQTNVGKGTEFERRYWRRREGGCCGEVVEVERKKKLWEEREQGCVWFARERTSISEATRC